MDYEQEVLIECIEHDEGVCTSYDVSQVVIPMWVGISLIFSFFFFFRVLEFVRSYYRKPKN